MAVLLPNGKQQYDAANGVPAVGYQLFTYDLNTTNPRTTWSDELQVNPNTNPIILDARGEAVIFWAGDYTVTLKDNLGSTIWSVNGINSNNVSLLDNFVVDTGAVNAYVANGITATTLVPGLKVAVQITNTNTGASTLNYGGLGVKPIIANGFSILAGALKSGVIYLFEYDGTNFQLLNQTPYELGNVLRYGIIPNNNGTTIAAANATILATLLNPAIPLGVTGVLNFPNTTGIDIYYFTGVIQIRDGVTIELNECTLNFFGSFNAAYNTFGFLTFIRDVVIQNGSIVVNYDGTGGINNGSAMRIGSRSGYAFGSYAAGIFDQDDLNAFGLPLQGNIRLSKLRIKSNNPKAHIILALGGLRNVIMEDVWLDGQGVVTFNGFYYEYGWSSTNGTPGTQNLWTSSHMTASSFKNMVITNLATGGTSQGFGANGAYGCTFEDIYISGADQGMSLGAGESFFYRTWALDGTTQRILNLRDITIKSCPLGIIMGGAQPTSGYLAAIIGALPFPQQYQAQTDFLNYNLDVFSISTPSGTAIIASGPNVAIRNGACNGGGINLSSECIHPTIENVQILNASGPNGIRCDFTPTIWSPQRPNFPVIRSNKITGSTGVGIGLGHCQSAIIENNQIGANVLYDVAAEATQTNGVNLAVTSFGVRCRNNFISTFGGAVAYQNINTSVDAMNSIENERNLQTTGGGGGWITDFQSPTAVVIATSGTIVVQNLRTIRLAPAGAVTGVIMAAGYASGHTVYLVNESANSITFAASGTSRVAAGAGAVIAAVTKMILVWDSVTNLWY